VFWRQSVAGGDRRGADAALVAALVGGATHREAAIAAHVSERTVGRRLADETFVRGLDEARAALVLRTADALATTAVDAVRTLAVLMVEEATPAPVRVAAARVVLDQATRYRQVDETEHRLRLLEALILSDAAL
jgi:hypothetical protein